MGHDIFVSYSTADKLFADALVNSLESRGLRCWYAPRDIPPGVRWPSAIAGAIKQVPVMLLIFSASANSSQEISRELTLASSNKRVVIPVRIENVLPSEELEYHLSNRHWLDVYHLEFESAVHQVLEVVGNYAHLFQRDGASGAKLTPDLHRDRQLIDDMARRKRIKKLLPALLLLLLLGVGSFLYWGGKADEANELLPATNAPVYIYGSEGGIGIKTLRLKSADPDGPQDFLLEVSGSSGSQQDSVFYICRLIISGDAYSFNITVDGERRAIFNVQQGVGTFYDPASGKAHRMVYMSEDKGWASVQKVLEAYKKQDR